MWILLPAVLEADTSDCMQFAECLGSYESLVDEVSYSDPVTDLEPY